MFKLPIKEVIINSSSVVTTTGTLSAPDDGDIVTIEGFGSFVVPSNAGGPFGHVTVSAPAVAGEFAVTAPADASLVVGAVYNLQLTFTQSGRVLSEIWSYGEQRTIQSAPLAAATQAAWVDAFIAGLVINKEYFGQEEVLSFADGGNDLDITFKAGYEGIGIKLARSIDSADITGIETTLAIVETTAPSEGVNLGKQIEAEVQNATFDNIDPYGIALGGNARGVDVRGTYTEIHWTAVAPLNGFEPHGMTGYGDANTETNHAATDQSAYLNEASVSADVITTLTALVTGIAP